MPNISRAFFYLTDLPNRWGRSLSEVGGWALAGRLNLMVPIPPVKCGDQTATGIVRVLAEDVARLFHPGNHAHFSCTVLRILPTDALAPLFADEHFVTLLRAEGLDSLPKYLADRIETA